MRRKQQRLQTEVQREKRACALGLVGATGSAECRMHWTAGLIFRSFCRGTHTTGTDQAHAGRAACDVGRYTEARLCLMVTRTTSLLSLVNRPPSSIHQASDFCTSASSEGAALETSHHALISTLCARNTGSVLTQLPDRSRSNPQ